ncbi:MAG TPA: cytochrome c [Noviherbaspirillum sp.]
MIQDTNIADAQKRENPDPHERNRPVPKRVILVVAAALIWAVGYIFLASPNDDPRLGDSRTLEDLTARAGGGGGAVDGAQLYSAQCAACHQATGAGVPGVFPPLAGSEWVTGSEKLAINILLHGVSGKLTVKGTSYEGVMPAFREKLGDAELAALLTHIRTNFGNSAGKIDVAAVAAEREAGKDRTAPWNGDEELTKMQ